MPPSLVAALEEITPGQSLPVQGGETQWGYVILLEKKEAHPKNALEMFAGVQDAIRRNVCRLCMKNGSKTRWKHPGFE